jgi:hypothetical protein
MRENRPNPQPHLQSTYPSSSAVDKQMKTNMDLTINHFLHGSHQTITVSTELFATFFLQLFLNRHNIADTTFKKFNAFLSFNSQKTDLFDFQRQFYISSKVSFPSHLN